MAPVTIMFLEARAASAVHRRDLDRTIRSGVQSQILIYLEFLALAYVLSPVFDSCARSTCQM